MKRICLILIIYFSNNSSWSQSVGIGVTTPTHAQMEISGRVGAVVAMFGAASGQYELSLSGESTMYSNSINYFVFVTPEAGSTVSYMIKANNTIEITTWNTWLQYTDASCGCATHSYITNAYAQQKADNAFNFLVYKFN